MRRPDDVQGSRCARIEARALTFLEAAQTAGFWVSADSRIGMQDAATLVGMAHGSLRNAVREGRGPHIYRIGGGGHKATISLLDLAEWIESRCSK